MKIFKWWQILIIVGGSLVVAALLFVVSFYSKLEDVQRWSLFAGMFFGLASACLSLTALWISIQTFVKTNLQEKEKIQKEANSFIVDNNEEIDYIPLCLMANAFNRHGKYCRKIYTNFNKLDNNIQREVLKQLNYDCEMIKSDKWIDEGLGRVKAFITQFDLGRDLLYDDSKYYRKTINYKEEEYSFAKEYAHLFRSDLIGLPKYFFRGKELIDKGICFFDYLKLFLNARMNNDFKAAVVPKPIDYLANAIDFDNIDEKDLCLWMMCLVDSCASLIIEINKKQAITRFPCCDGSIETYEDRFLVSLSHLYDVSKLKIDKK